MSEFLKGMPPAPTPGPPKDAAAVIVFRRAATGVELFWLRRDTKLRFAAGFFAFPGGRVDAADASIAVEGDSDPRLRAAAARELFEETGLLKARGAEKLAAAQLEQLRRELLEEKKTFAQILDQHALRLHAGDFLEAGRWVTPPYLPSRFDARFFLVEAPPSQTAEVWPGELADGAWTTPQAALEKWKSGEALLHPPNLNALEVMSRFRTAQEAATELQTPPHCLEYVAQRLEFQRGIRLCPLRTPTLPPATHTNCYLLGSDQLLLVDPGASDSKEIEPLFACLDALKKEGLSVQAVVLTHHHFDHAGGLALLRQRHALPLWAHPLTASTLGLKVDRELNDGEVLTAGEMQFRVLHTPGHARGHICLLHEKSRAAVVGDMVASVGTIVIDPPEGNMAEYLKQLARLEPCVSTLYPAHGSAIVDGPAKIREYLTHRAWREQKVLEALGPAPLTLDALVPRAYDDVQAFVWPLAERNTVAIIEKLIAEGRVQRTADTYARIS